ncbi:MAG: hypothetical protein AB7O65_12725 [Candidatus Korobacteraceae bacterium]
MPSIDAPLPIIIGVTGHRDLRPNDVPHLERIVGKELEAIQRRYPHSSLVLLSPLAEGSDRLAARAALKLGYSLIVPLPLCRELYEQDFTTEASRKEFADLLGRAIGWIPLPLLPGNTPESVRLPGPSRDREYAKLGAFIASSSQILLALWDGVGLHGSKVGGTANVVRFQLEGLPILYDSQGSNLTQPVSVGPVRHIVTPRQSMPELSLLPLSRRLLVPANRTEESFLRLYDRMDLFNRDARELRSLLEKSAQNSQLQLLNTDADELPKIVATLPAPCEHILNQYALADGLAIHFGGKTLSALQRVFIGVAASALLFNLHSALFQTPGEVPASFQEAFFSLPWQLIGCMASSTFTALWLYGRTKKAECQSKYQDYRALAEALRIQFFWKVAGLSESVSDKFLRKQRSDLDWLRGALRSWHILAVMTRPDRPPAPAQCFDGDRLLMNWIRDQKTYFARRAKKEQAKLRQEARIASVLLKLGAGLSGTLVLFFCLMLIRDFPYGEPLRRLLAAPSVHQIILLVIAMLGVSAALYQAYGDQLARAEHIRQFTRMSELFDLSEGELSKLMAEGHPQKTTALVRELGIEALEDSADWLILHRERPIEVPHG